MRLPVRTGLGSRDEGVACGRPRAGAGRAARPLGTPGFPSARGGRVSPPLHAGVEAARAGVLRPGRLGVRLARLARHRLGSKRQAWRQLQTSPAFLVLVRAGSPASLRHLRRGRSCGPLHRRRRPTYHEPATERRRPTCVRSDGGHLATGLPVGQAEAEGDFMKPRGPPKKTRHTDSPGSHVDARGGSKATLRHRAQPEA